VDTALRMRRAVPIALAALAVLAAGCSASDEPADPTTTAPPAATEPAAPTATAAPTGTAATSAAPTGTAATGTAASGAQASGQVISVVVAGGRVTPAPATVVVKLGETITVEVTADVADEVHVHGYDKLLPVRPGSPARVQLAAVIPGQFDVELENAKLVLFTLRVT